MNMMIRLIAVSVMGVSMAACSDWQGACAAAGVCDPPPPSPVTLNLICDHSQGSTCTRRTLEDTLRVLVAELSERPGSELRLWMIGSTVDQAALAGTASAPPLPRSRGARQSQLDSFRLSTIGTLVAATDAHFDRPPARSPIIDTLARVLMVGTVSGRQTAVVISDAREFGRLDFECGRLPAPGDLLERMRAERVLPQTSLMNTTVAFTYVGIPPVDRARCAASIQRTRDIEDLWRELVTGSGGQVTAFRDGVVTVGDLNLEDGR